MLVHHRVSPWQSYKIHLGTHILSPGSPGEPSDFKGLTCRSAEIYVFCLANADVVATLDISGSQLEICFNMIPQGVP